MKTKPRPPSPRPTATPQADALTAREQLFVRLVHTTHNKTQAYIDVGHRCSRETAAANAHRLLRKARVRQALTALAAARVERLAQAGDEELELAGQLMRFNVRDLYDANGQPFPIHKLPRHVAVAIKTIRPTAYGIVFEFHDKVRLIELRLRAFGRLVDKHQIEAGASLIDVLAAIARGGEPAR
jgi:Terminase small subunit